MNIRKPGYFDEIGKPEDQLQAVLIVDIFEDKFLPISGTLPCALLPVVNKIAIDYTIESIIMGGINKIMVVLTRNTERVSEHIRASDYYVNKKAEFEIINVRTPNPSVADIFREIDHDSRSHLRGEFIVINGMAICGSALRNLIDRHMARRFSDDRVIMTVVFNRFPLCNQRKDMRRDVLVLGDSETNEILYIQSQHDNQFKIPAEPLYKRPFTDVHYDLNYSGIYFFDLRTLQLFSDNFDFQTIEDLILNVVGDDILQRTICYDIVGEGYVGTISDMRLYHTISFDIVNRWTFPSTPDKNGYTLHSDHVYIGDFVEVDRSVDFRGEVVIGHRTTIGNRCVLDRSIIGDNCYIGSNTKIINSCIWAKVKIESNCTIQNSIICSDATVLHHTELSNGCLLSFGVTVGPGAVLPKRTIVHIPKRPLENVDTTLFIHLGMQCNGTIYNVHEFDLPNYEWGLPSLKRIIIQPSDSEDSSIEDVDDDDEIDFDNAIKDVVFNGFTENVPVDTIITEINVAKHTFNVSIDRVNDTALNSTLDYCFVDTPNEQSDIMAHLRKKFISISPFCRQYFNNSKLQRNLFKSFEEQVYKREEFKKLYSRAILQLYGNDIIDLDFLQSMLENDFDSDEDQDHTEFRTEKIKSIVEWIKVQEAEQEEEESEEEDQESAGNSEADDEADHEG